MPARVGIFFCYPNQNNQRSSLKKYGFFAGRVLKKIVSYLQGNGRNYPYETPNFSPGIPHILLISNV
jgi:hypothetical protein